GSVCEETTGTEGVWRFAVQSEELTFDLRQLQRQTEQELSNIQTQLCDLEDRRRLLSSELFDLQEKKKQTDQELRTDSSLQTSTFEPRSCRELQVSIAERLAQSERLVFQEDALSALRNLLTQDLQRYQEETQNLSRFSQKIQNHRWDQEQPAGLQSLTHSQSLHSMQGKTETEQHNNNNMRSVKPAGLQADGRTDRRSASASMNLLFTAGGNNRGTYWRQIASGQTSRDVSPAGETDVSDNKLPLIASVI
ncbi:uncharacterized protein, partial [Centroberyx affinis]|uniref:uncharacterized protein n=1 Tax=Centroberyx affinis TaxID=166261 RepID=UPI003A5C714E